MGRTIYCDYTASGSTAEQLNLYTIVLDAQSYTGRLDMPGWGTGVANLPNQFGITSFVSELRANFPYPCGASFNFSGSQGVNFWFVLPNGVPAPTDWVWTDTGTFSTTLIPSTPTTIDVSPKCYSTGIVDLEAASPGFGDAVNWALFYYVDQLGAVDPQYGGFTEFAFLDANAELIYNLSGTTLEVIIKNSYTVADSLFFDNFGSSTQHSFPFTEIAC